MSSEARPPKASLKRSSPWNVAASFSIVMLATSFSATTVLAEQPIVRLFDLTAGDGELLAGLLPDDTIRAVKAAAPAPELDFKVLIGRPELGLGHDWVIAQLITDQTCNAQGECVVYIRHSSPGGWVTVAEVMAVDVTWIDDGSDPIALLFSGLNGPAIWRWNGSAYAFDRIGDDDLMDAYYAATGGDTY